MRHNSWAMSHDVIDWGRIKLKNQEKFNQSLESDSSTSTVEQFFLGILNWNNPQSSAKHFLQSWKSVQVKLLLVIISLQLVSFESSASSHKSILFLSNLKTCRNTEFDMVALPISSVIFKSLLNSPERYECHLFRFMLIETYSPFVRTSRSKVFLAMREMTIFTSICSDDIL